MDQNQWVSGWVVNYNNYYILEQWLLRGKRSLLNNHWKSFLSLITSAYRNNRKRVETFFFFSLRISRELEVLVQWVHRRQIRIRALGKTSLMLYLFDKRSRISGSSWHHKEESILDSLRSTLMLLALKKTVLNWMHLLMVIK